MPFARAAARDYIDLAGAASSVFGTVGIRRDFELLNGVHGRLEIIAIILLVVVIDAIEHEVIELFAAAVHMHSEGSASGKLRALHWRRDAGRQQRQLQEIPFVERKPLDDGL